MAKMERDTVDYDKSNLYEKNKRTDQKNYETAKTMINIIFQMRCLIFI